MKGNTGREKNEYTIKKTNTNASSKGGESKALTTAVPFLVKKAKLLEFVEVLFTLISVSSDPQQLPKIISGERVSEKR